MFNERYEITAVTNTVVVKDKKNGGTLTFVYPNKQQLDESDLNECKDLFSAAIVNLFNDNIITVTSEVVFEGGVSLNGCHLKDPYLFNSTLINVNIPNSQLDCQYSNITGYKYTGDKDINVAYSDSLDCTVKAATFYAGFIVVRMNSTNPQ